ncbi:hypothetical protein RSOLAG22IIIB_10952 [Rhizoctonia solani]|uniref:Uncharacterized protein n=1 Tax=Rhizoctonia solani TaxID=456999 RepID=A0A0K6G635_9AGAM|nr:hypothetical protein RSOLAG22IIIB_10952 [Rhizoctonia solani]
MSFRVGLHYTPIPFNVTPISPLFDLLPIASSNTSLGWVPSCTTPECVPTASWSTSAVNATLSFQYWGRGVAFDGDVKGNMSVQLIQDGMHIPWAPSGGTLFGLKGNPIDIFYPHKITLKVLDASSDAQLSVVRARVNGSSFTNGQFPVENWIVPSSEDRLKYTGFTQKTNLSQIEPSVTHVSSQAGDSVSMQFNGTTILVHGSCGPESGLMRVTIDGQQQTVNTSKPFASNDCLLFEAWGLTSTYLHRILVENVDGRTLGINRFELFRVHFYGGPDAGGRTVQVACGIASVFVAGMIMIGVYVRRSANKWRGVSGSQANRGWFLSS